ncbi:MAG: protein kinase [Deltaproteobacteria bacterium]|nr:protein kinase [Deltaproteobacteria bacterium]
MADFPSILKGKYRLIRKIDSGGMGVVYEAVHLDLDCPCAIKSIRIELEEHPDFTARFRREGQILARLRHPNIVGVMDCDFEPGFGHFLVMEFVRGVDLSATIRSTGGLEYSEVLRIGQAVASALDYAHKAGVVHRDIKAKNILLEKGTGRPVVLDFGVAKLMAGEEGLTRSGDFLGTYRYSAPEQIRLEDRGSIDARVDIYALGILLYEMFSGRKFLANIPEKEIAQLVAYHPNWEPPMAFRAGTPPSFVSLVTDCVQRQRERRVSGADEVSRRLGLCPLEICDDVTRPEPLAPLRRRWQPPRVLRNGAWLLLLAGIGGLLMWHEDQLGRQGWWPASCAPSRPSARRVVMTNVALADTPTSTPRTSLNPAPTSEPTATKTRLRSATPAAIPTRVRMASEALFELRPKGSGLPVRAQLLTRDPIHVGDQMRFAVECDVDCYVAVISIGTTAKLNPIFPNSMQSSELLHPGESLIVPTESYELQVSGPPGIERLKIIATSAPINLAPAGKQLDLADVDKIREVLREVPWGESIISLRVDP